MEVTTGLTRVIKRLGLCNLCQPSGKAKCTSAARVVRIALPGLARRLVWVTTGLTLWAKIRPKVKRLSKEFSITINDYKRGQSGTFFDLKSLEFPVQFLNATNCKGKTKLAFVKLTKNFHTQRINLSGCFIAIPKNFNTVAHNQIFKDTNAFKEIWLAAGLTIGITAGLLTTWLLAARLLIPRLTRL
jgi:hypothetical protein